MRIRDYRNENRSKDKFKKLSQDGKKKLRVDNQRGKYENIRELVKEIQHSNNESSRKRKQMGGHYPRNCSRKISITEGHKISDQKDLAK